MPTRFSQISPQLFRIRGQRVREQGIIRQPTWILLPRMQSIAMALLLSSSAAVYLALLRLDAVNGIWPVALFLGAMAALFLLYALAIRVVSHSSAAATWKWVMAGALLFRLILIPAGLPARSGDKAALLAKDLAGSAVTYERFLLFDNDIWRYLWDGHATASGVNPYRFAPADEAVDRVAEGSAVWSEVRENVSFPTVPTIYPALGQMVFRFSHWLAPGSVAVMKMVLVAFDLVAAVFLALTLRATGQNPALAVVYAWNPLVVKVFAGSGHVDAVAVACLAAMGYFLAKARPGFAGVCLGLAVLAKLSPLVLLPFFWRRAGWRATVVVFGVVGLGYAPFAGAGPGLVAGLLTFGKFWQFNAGPYELFRRMGSFVLPLHSPVTPEVAAKTVCGLLFALVLWRVWRRESPSTAMANEVAPVLGWLLLLSPTAMPWYLTWALPAAVVARQWVWVWWTATACLSFLVMIDGRERWFILAAEYGILLVVWWSKSLAGKGLEEKRRTL